MLRKNRIKKFLEDYDGNIFINKSGKLNAIINCEHEFECENGKWYSGIIRATDIKSHNIGTLKYIIHPFDCKATLCDIYLIKKYRNVGIGGKMIAQFEMNCLDHGVKYIEGMLSNVDEYEGNEELRNNFYINHGYIINDKFVKKELK